MTVRGPPGRTEPRRPGGIVAASRPLGPGTVAARRHPGSYGPGTAGRTLQKQKHRPASLPLGRLRDIPADMAPQGRRRADAQPRCSSSAATTFRRAATSSGIPASLKAFGAFDFFSEVKFL